MKNHQKSVIIILASIVVLSLIVVGAFALSNVNNNEPEYKKANATLSSGDDI